MSPRASRWLLFATLALTLPVPFVMAGVEIAPLARLIFLEGILLAVVAVDGLAGTAGLFALLLAVQGLVFTALLWGLASVAGRTLARVRPATRAACVGVATLALLCLSLLGVYRTPSSSSGTTANLLGIFD